MPYAHGDSVNEERREVGGWSNGDCARPLTTISNNFGAIALQSNPVIPGKLHQ